MKTILEYLVKRHTSKKSEETRKYVVLAVGLAFTKAKYPHNIYCANAENTNGEYGNCVYTDNKFVGFATYDKSDFKNKEIPTDDEVKSALLLARISGYKIYKFISKKYHCECICAYSRTPKIDDVDGELINIKDENSLEL